MSTNIRGIRLLTMGSGPRLYKKRDEKFASTGIGRATQRYSFSSIGLRNCQIDRRVYVIYKHSGTQSE